MGLSEMLGKWDSIKNTKPQNHSNGLGALGMAEPTELHWNLARILAKVVESRVFDNEIIVGVESRTIFNNTYRVYDVVAKRYSKKSDILNNIPAKTLFVIEIAHFADIEKDKQKIFDAWKIYGDIKEAFVLDYDNYDWYKLKDGKFIESDCSKFISTNLAPIVEDYIESLKN